MALKLLAHGSLQTPNYPKAEGLSVGTKVSIVAGGFSLGTNWRCRCPADKINTVHYETKKWTINASPSTYWQFGFFVSFDNVDVDSGEPDFPFWSLMRNGLPDVSLQLATDFSGHKLELLDANGVAQDEDLNTFDEDGDHWIEIYGHHIVMAVYVDGLLKLLDIGDYKGDATGDQEAYFRFEGQVDAAPGPANTSFAFGQWYAAEDSAGVSDFNGFKRLEVYEERHIDGTVDAGCDEDGDFPGDGEDLDNGIWSNTNDDLFTTFAEYVGVVPDRIGSIKIMDGPGGNYRPTAKFAGSLFVAVLTSDTGGTYKWGFGSRRSEFNYSVATESVGVRRQYVQNWSLPGVLPHPAAPHEFDLAAIGHFVEAFFSVGKKLRMLDCYHFLFGPLGQAKSGWPKLIVQREHFIRGASGRGAICRGVNR